MCHMSKRNQYSCKFDAVKPVLKDQQALNPPGFLKIILGLTLGILSYDPLAFSQPVDPPSALSPSQTVTLDGTFEMWQERAQDWYQHADLKSRRKQMRALSRPLKRPCYYCHTRSFKGYVESTYLISLQMMAISAEQDVTCAACHSGRRRLTKLGAKSLIQWRYAQEKGLDCRDCHTPKGRFRTLTIKGEAARPQLIKEIKARGEQWGVDDHVIREWLATLEKSLPKKNQPTPTIIQTPSNVPYEVP